jgi:ADP-ribosyl-[dinitrogen reductase] hydrolase
LKSIDGFAGLLQYRAFNAQIGALAGLLVADAVGVGFEFKSPEQILPRDQIDMQTPTGFSRSHAGVSIGTWSDDGAQMLCLLASLVEQGKFSLTDFSAKLLRWLNTGYMAVDGHVFDVGNQTARALAKLRDGVSPLESGGKGEYENGNGSLMRVLPLALWSAGTDEALVRDAHLQSLPTHAHPRSMVCCAFYCLVVRGYLQGLVDPWSSGDQRLEAVYRGRTGQREREVFLQELDLLRDFPKTDNPSGSGYVVDTLWSARTALEESKFEDVVRSAILFGNDTDTTAAIAGGLAGIRLGIAGIPERWLSQLRGFELVQPLIPAFLAKMQRNGATTPPRPLTPSS